MHTYPTENEQPLQDAPSEHDPTEVAEHIDDLLQRIATLEASGMPTPASWNETLQFAKALLNFTDQAGPPDAEELAALEGNVQAWEEIATEYHQQSRKRPTADVGYAIVRPLIIEAFRDRRGEPHITISERGRPRTLAVNSTSTGDWMTATIRAATGKVPTRQAIDELRSTIAADCAMSRLTYDVAVRRARVGDEVWFDLGTDDELTYVRIGDGAWTRERTSPVRFVRPPTLHAMPLPARGGDLKELFEFVNVDESDQPVVLGALVAALGSAGPIPVLAIIGGAGTAKTTGAKLMKRLIDPNEGEVRMTSPNPQDSFIAAKSNLVVPYDNVSHISQAMSDALCMLATGGSTVKRKLYTNEDEHVMNVRALVVITAIGNVITQPDLLSRTITVHPKPLGAGARRTEKEILEAFEERRPKLLGALFDAVAAGLAGEASVPAGDLPRMADAFRIAIAAEEALGYAPGQMLQALNDNAADLEVELADESALIEAIEMELDHRPASLEGSAAELHAKLSTGEWRHSPSWPKDGHALGMELSRQKSLLERKGIMVERVRTATMRGWRITRKP